MDSQAQASFIPKKTLATGGPRPGFSGLITLVSIIVFIASGVTAGAAFGYQQFLKAAITSKQDSLAKYEAAYDLSTIQTLARFDSRITQAKMLLSKHTAPSGFFLFLSQQTLASVQFTSLDYELQEDGTATVKLDGIADSFNTVALQSDQFGASKVLKDVIFSDLVIGDKGQVSFTVNATVNSSVILYSKNLNVTIPTASVSDQTQASSTPATASSTPAAASSTPTAPHAAPQP